jgi:hypothetical protein
VKRWVLVRFALQGRLNPSGQNQTTGDIGWIVFTSTKTADDVKNFYTSDRMMADVWQATNKSPCLSGRESGVAQVGDLCVFQKQQGSHQIQLAIIALQDDQTKQTNLFFLRLEAAATPSPSN